MDNSRVRSNVKYQTHDAKSSASQDAGTAATNANTPDSTDRSTRFEVECLHSFTARSGCED